MNRSGRQRFRSELLQREVYHLNRPRREVRFVFDNREKEPKVRLRPDATAARLEIAPGLITESWKLHYGTAGCPDRRENTGQE